MSKYAVMFFDTELNLGISNTPEKWVNFNNYFTDDGFIALEVYANTRCPASQLIKAKDDEELKKLMDEMINKFKNKDWLNNELYPFL